MGKKPAAYSAELFRSAGSDGCSEKRCGHRYAQAAACKCAYERKSTCVFRCRARSYGEKLGCGGIAFPITNHNRSPTKSRHLPLAKAAPRNWPCKWFRAALITPFLISASGRSCCVNQHAFWSFAAVHSQSASRPTPSNADSGVGSRNSK